VRPKGGGIGIDDYTGYYAKHDKDSRCFIVAKLHDFWGFSFSFIAGDVRNLCFLVLARSGLSWCLGLASSF
jgi:hypothetical protein